MIVLALHDLGEQYLELHGEQVDRFLADLPDATSNVEEPCLEVATSHGVRRSTHGDKVADAARGTPETSPGVLRSLEVV